MAIESANKVDLQKQIPAEVANTLGFNRNKDKKNLADMAGIKEYKSSGDQNLAIKNFLLDPKNKEQISQLKEKIKEELKPYVPFKAKLYPSERLPELSIAYQNESKETLSKSLEFEKDTFKIDSTGWKEIEKGGRKVKINDTGDVTEFVDGDQKGEQIFVSYDTFIREVCKAKNCSKEEAEKKYLMTSEEYMQKMNAINQAGIYTDFYNNEIKDHLAGCWTPGDKRFYGVGERSHVWLAGGSSAHFDQSEWLRYYNDRHFGFSGRLLKN